MSDLMPDQVSYMVFLKHMWYECSVLGTNKMCKFWMIREDMLLWDNGPCFNIKIIFWDIVMPVIETRRGWFSTKMTSFWHRNSQCGDKMTLLSCYLHKGISYAGKLSSYWIRTLIFVMGNLILVWWHLYVDRSFCTNTPISQIPKCICAISHNASFCNRNVHMCAHFCYKMVHCGIFARCVVQHITDNLGLKYWNIICYMQTLTLMYFIQSLL